MTPVGDVSDVDTPPELRTFTGSVIDPAGIAPPANDTYNTQINLSSTRIKNLHWHTVELSPLNNTY